MKLRYTFLVFFLVIVMCISTFFIMKPENIDTLTCVSCNNLSYVSEGHKTILYWNSFFSDRNFNMGEGFIAEHCPLYNNCYAMNWRYAQSHEKFDAILFHGINHQLNDKDLPKKRSSEQKYIFMTLESPANRWISSKFNDYFNATMTYKLDSDITWTYADIVDKTQRVIVPAARENIHWKSTTEMEAATAATSLDAEAESRLDALMNGKRKLAVWYRSNCITPSAREKYVEELERYANVDKFGSCSSNKGCPRGQDCFKTQIEPEYFFYLSFENSLCVDYVTEKFFDALKHYVVPVVYGGANYSQFAPPKSYINALDFNSPKDLGQYLLTLSQNKTEYKKYFAWKKFYRVESPIKRVICDLCKFVNEKTRRSYDISEWFSINSCPIQRKLKNQYVKNQISYATKKTIDEKS
ncbi:alpha-(1,3)-fucosyltransferase C-like isoform X1 [Trichogramma pretiosum]|uniref:alpha-(1,3)-fucosyltransferase C-like isoform X1 n=2 Tax=Trichogramma pretiosum TaxID=7493 RepID=UPI000C71B8B1|nr:alpha-(1,3)-fucosyltransferase C-like isoform X1 [Trichogramma pretiosum]